MVRLRYGRYSVPSGVIFGGSADNGYARLLQPYIGDRSKNKRIILIEGPPFVKELAGLKDKFLVACFPDIFRHTNYHREEYHSPRRRLPLQLHIHLATLLLQALSMPRRSDQTMPVTPQ